MNVPLRGEIWLVRLDPTKGSEIRKTRPCLIISDDRRNQVSRIVTLIPITSGALRFRSFQIELGESSGVKKVSYLDIPQLRVADSSRLLRKVAQIDPILWREIYFKTNLHLGFTAYLA